MKIRLKTYIILFTLALLVFSVESCDEKKSIPIEDLVPGHYLKLKKDKIEIFAPLSFVQHSNDEYEAILKKIVDSTGRISLLEDYKGERISWGNLYNLKEKREPTEWSIKMHRYYDFTKKDASYLLGMLSEKCNKFAWINEGACKKIKGSYSYNGKFKVFKGLYELTIDNKKFYSCRYLITSRGKTFLISTFSPIDTNFDPYIKRIKFT